MNSECEALEAGGIGCLGALFAGVGLLGLVGALFEQSVAGLALAVFAVCVGSAVFLIGTDSGRRPPHPTPAPRPALPELPRFRRRHPEVKRWRRGAIEIPDEARGKVPTGRWAELRLALAVTGIAALLRGAGSWWAPALLAVLLAARMLATRTPAPRPPRP